MKTLLSTLIGLALALGNASAALADSAWPQKPLRTVIGFEAGGGADQTLLPLKPLLDKALGQPLAFEYKPGADGQLSWELLQRTGDDGYTISGLSFPHLPASVALRKPSYTLDDFAPVGIVASDVPVLFVRNDSRFKNLTDLLDEARAKPNTVTLAIGSFSGEHYITALALEKQTGVKFRFVNTRGGGKVLSNILGGHMDVGVARPSVISAVLNEVRGIAVSSEDRHHLIPETPTFKEQLPATINIPLLRNARGLVVTKAFKNANPEGFNKLVAALKTSAESAEYKGVLDRLGLDAIYLGPDEATKYMMEYRATIENYKSLLESSN